MGLNDFLKATARIGSKGRSTSGQRPGSAHVKEFDRGQLENAASQMSSEPGAVESFLDNVGSFFRPTGTFATAAVDYVGGEDSTKNLLSGVRDLSKKAKEAGVPDLLRKAQHFLPVPAFDVAASFIEAPTGDLANTEPAKVYRAAKTALTGVDPDQQKEYVTDQFLARVARATEGSGFNDVARSIAENRQGQKQDNLVERTLGKIPAVGAYFDKAMPSVEDKAIEAGATPEQAMFLSMLNPLEWLNAESKTDAAAKLEKAGAGALRKTLNRVASPLVDPLQAGLDVAFPGKAKPLSQVDEVVNAAPIESAVSDPVRTRFANNLGIDVNDLPVEQLDEAAKIAPAESLPASPIAAADPVDEFVKAVSGPPVTGQAIEPSREAPVNQLDEVVDEAIPQSDELNYVPASFPAEKPLIEESLQAVPKQVVEPPTTMDFVRSTLGEEPVDELTNPYRGYNDLSVEPPAKPLPGANANVDNIFDDAAESFNAKRNARYPMQVMGGLPLPTVDAMKAFKGDLDSLVDKIKDSKLSTSLSRWFSSTSLGKVDAATTAALRDAAEASEGFSRALADTYHKVLNGDIAGVIGSTHGGRYNLSPIEKTAIGDFMGGKVKNGARVDEQALRAMNIPQDVIDVSKLVRGMMDKTSDALMAETHNLPLTWFNKLNDEDRAIVAGLAQTASRPNARKTFEASVSPAKIQFLDEARQHVDKGFAELNAAGHWLDGEDPRDMLLDWAPHLANRGTYQPLLYRLFEHGVLGKGDDAMQLYLSTLKSKGVNVSPEVEAFLYTNWAAGGAGKATANELDRVRKRNPNMPQEIKDLLQEIEDPAYSYAKGIYQVNRMKNNLALRRWMAGQERFVSKAGESAVDFARRTGYDFKDFVELGSNVGASPQRFGAMMGRFIHRDFWDLAFQVHALPGIQNGVDMAMQFNKAILQRWKFWHTVANPASHVRQGVQNLVSIYLAGGYKAIANLPSAIKGFREKGNVFSLARQNGLLGNKSLSDIAAKIDDSAWKHLDFNAAESFIARLGTFGETIAKMSEGFRVGGGKKAASAWQYIDEVARIALFKTYLDKGWPVKEAAEAVKGEVYGGTRRSRVDQLIAGVPLSSTFADIGADGSVGANFIKGADWASIFVNIPFWGASRFILEQSMRNIAGMKPGSWKPLTDPGRMARTAALGLASYSLFKHWQDAEGLQPADEVSQRPDYMRPFVPMNARIPNSTMELIDDKGKVGYIDWSWALPWGGLASQGFNPKTGKMESRAAGSEFVQISPLIKPFFETAFNKDLFREEIGARSEIYNPLDTAATKARKSTAHVWRAWLPPWAVNPAGGLVDVVNADGGADGHVDAKEAMRAFMQGVANDSGHTASKTASGIYNSFDYWWNQRFPDGQERLQVSDYMGREQYLVKAVADALALKITSTDLRQIEKRRKTARTTAIQGMKQYYKQQRSLTTNPATIRSLRDAESKNIAQINAGRPVPQWYDETPEDTWMNVRQFFAEKLSSGR